MGTKVTGTYVCSNAMDWIHLAPHGIAFQVTPELLRAYLAPDVDWDDWKPSLHDDGVAGPVEEYGEPIAVRHATEPVEVLEPETWARRLAFYKVEHVTAPITRIDWDTTSDPSNPGWVGRQGGFCWPIQGYEPDATDAELIDAADAWAPAGVTVATAEVARWSAALKVARDCGAEWARQSPSPTPEWTGEPIIGGDWDAIEAALGTDPAGIDSVANQELIDAWLAGYEAVRNAEGVDDA